MNDEKAQSCRPLAGDPRRGDLRVPLCKTGRKTSQSAAGRHPLTFTPRNPLSEKLRRERKQPRGRKSEHKAPEAPSPFTPERECSPLGARGDRKLERRRAILSRLSLAISAFVSSFNKLQQAFLRGGPGGWGLGTPCQTQALYQGETQGQAGTD